MKFLSFRRKQTQFDFHCAVALKTAAHIKRIVSDPYPQFDIDLVPLGLPAQLRSTLRLAMQICVQHTFTPHTVGTFPERSRQFISHIRMMPTVPRNGTYLKIASVVLDYLDSGKKKEWQYDKAVQDGYAKWYKGKKVVL